MSSKLFSASRSGFTFVKRWQCLLHRTALVSLVRRTQTATRTRQWRTTNGFYPFVSNCIGRYDAGSDRESAATTLTIQNRI